MKIRNGFVSNSSSSSFIIAYLEKKSEPCPMCGHVSQNIIDCISKHSDVDGGIDAVGVDEVVVYIKNMFDDEKDLQNCIKNVQLYADDGFKVAVVSIGYHDEYSKELMDELIKKQELFNIWGENE